MMHTERTVGRSISASTRPSTSFLTAVPCAFMKYTVLGVSFSLKSPVFASIRSLSSRRTTTPSFSNAAATSADFSGLPTDLGLTGCSALAS